MPRQGCVCCIDCVCCSLEGRGVASGALRQKPERLGSTRRRAASTGRGSRAFCLAWRFSKAAQRDAAWSEALECAGCSSAGLRLRPRLSRALSPGPPVAWARRLSFRLSFRAGLRWAHARAPPLSGRLSSPRGFHPAVCSFGSVGEAEASSGGFLMAAPFLELAFGPGAASSGCAQAPLCLAPSTQAAARRGCSA